MIVGLTGSIGMGKSTVARMFADLGAALWDADAAVHDLYAKDGAAVGAIAALFPEAPAIVVDGAIDRGRLAKIVLADRDALAALEQIVHPLVGAHRAAFIDRAARSGAQIAIFDIPLLFENASGSFFDAVIVVSAPAEMQRARVLARDGMTTDKFDAIARQQMPDSEKRALGDYIIDTGQSLARTREAVKTVWDELMAPAREKSDH